MSFDLPNIDNITPVLSAAGKVILEIYNNQAIKVDYKADDSPLTQADTAANEIIEAYLSSRFDFPIVSEEGTQLNYEQRKSFTTFWLVDPLDGTKEFINRNGEFTVNIALIKNGKAVFGGIYVPVQDTYYFGDEKNGAFKKVGNGPLQALKVNDSLSGIIAVGSKSHAKPEEQDFYNAIGVQESVAVGSSLKFCLIAEGKASVYFRSGPTMEWDTAAGQAIVKAAGGNVYVDQSASKEFTYNKENLLNGSFVCAANKALLANVLNDKKND